MSFSAKYFAAPGWYGTLVMEEAKVKAQLCLLCVADVVDVIEGSGNKVVDSCLGNVVASNDLLLRQQLW